LRRASSRGRIRQGQGSDTGQQFVVHHEVTPDDLAYRAWGCGEVFCLRIIRYWRQPWLSRLWDMWCGGWRGRMIHLNASSSVSSVGVVGVPRYETSATGLCVSWFCSV